MAGQPSIIPSWTHHLQTENTQSGAFAFLPQSKQIDIINGFIDTRPEITERFADTHVGAIASANPLSKVAKRKRVHSLLVTMEEFFSYLLIKEAEIRQLIKEIRTYRARHRYDGVDFSFDISKEGEERLVAELRKQHLEQLAQFKLTLTRLESAIPAVHEHVVHWEKRKAILLKEQQIMEEAHLNSQVACIMQALINTAKDPSSVRLPERQVLVQMARNLTPTIDNRAKGPSETAQRVTRDLHIPDAQALSQHNRSTFILMIGSLREALRYVIDGQEQEVTFSIRESIAIAESLQATRMGQLDAVNALAADINFARTALGAAQAHEAALQSHVLEIRNRLRVPEALQMPETQSHIDRLADQSDRMLRQLEANQYERANINRVAPTSLFSPLSPLRTTMAANNNNATNYDENEEADARASKRPRHHHTPFSTRPRGQ